MRTFSMRPRSALSASSFFRRPASSFPRPWTAFLLMGFLPGEPVDLPQEFPDDVLLGDLAEELPFPEDRGFPPAASQPQVRFPGLSGPVHRAAHDRQDERDAEPGDPGLDLGGEPEDVELDPAAGRAGDDHRPDAPQVERRKDAV